MSERAFLNKHKCYCITSLYFFPLYIIILLKSKVFQKEDFCWSTVVCCCLSLYTPDCQSLKYTMLPYAFFPRVFSARTPWFLASNSSTINQNALHTMRPGEIVTAFFVHLFSHSLILHRGYYGFYLFPVLFCMHAVFCTNKPTRVGIYIHFCSPKITEVSKWI